MYRFVSVEVPFVLSSSDGQTGQPIQSVTIYLTITVSATATSHPILPINATNAKATEVDVSLVGQATRPIIAQDSVETTSSVVTTAPESLSPPADHVPVETSISIPPVPDVQTTMSPAENVLRGADKSNKTINLTSTRKGAVARIEWVMDTVSSVAGVRCRAITFDLVLD